jgi:3-oxoacyl-[acyl-carrier protein] reductase
VETGLEGKAALVTGAAGGIGRACCTALAAEGARVACADIDGQSVAMAALLFGGHPVAGDVSTTADAERIVEESVTLTGSLDVLVTSHGVFHSTALTEITADEWDHIQSVNLRGTFLVCKAALEVMAEHRSGVIITVASLAGQVGGLQAGAGYAASKAGVAALTKSLARWAGPLGIRVNCVNPGFIDTSMTGTWPEDVRQDVIGRTPLGRIGTAEEVAAAVTWLASDQASFVHGAHLDVNGGLHMA